jgi:predicted Zn-dependent protease
MVSLSQFPEYLAAIPAAAAGDFASARSSFESLLAKIESHASPEQAAFVLQLLADVEAQSGNTEKSLSLHERAIAIDPSNPLTRLNCAKSLINVLKCPALALVRVQEAESLLASDTWQSTEDDMSRQWYEHEIHLVRQGAQAV